MSQTDITKREETTPESTRPTRTAVPRVDVYENEDEILVHADLPGVSKDQITIDLDNGRLSLKGLRQLKTQGAAAWEEFGDVEYQRVFAVPQGIETNKIDANLKDGVLELHLPKSEATKPRQIEIKTG